MLMTLMTDMTTRNPGIIFTSQSGSRCLNFLWGYSTCLRTCLYFYFWGWEGGLYSKTSSRRLLSSQRSPLANNVISATLFHLPGLHLGDLFISFNVGQIFL